MASLCPYRARLLLAAGALALYATVPAEAQVARGTVVDEDGQPVRTALVLLLDGTGKQRAATLTDTVGAFILRAPSAGSYKLRVERIGYRTTEGQVVELPAGSVVERRVVAAALPVELPALTAAAKRRCTSRPAEGEAVAVLWYEVRKGLQASQLSGPSRSYSFRTFRWIRRLDLPALNVVSDSSRERIEFSRGSPFVSAPVEQLLERGFMVPTDDGGTIFYAPDARVLLSDEFANAYCLTPTEDPEHGRIGIHFRPVERSGPPAVTGTLWLDRITLELRQLAYGYTRATLPEGPVNEVGGLVEFDRLPDGSWVVWRWRIRMPLAGQKSVQLGRSGSLYRTVMIGIREEGAEIREVIRR